MIFVHAINVKKSNKLYNAINNNLHSRVSHSKILQKCQFYFFKININEKFKLRC